MKSVLALVAAAALLTFTASGCSMAHSVITGSLVVNSVKGPLAVGDNTAGHSKVGNAEATSILGFAMGDCSIKAAMDSVQMTKIHHVDYETFSILMLFAKYKTVVYGD
jgi:hypothetical protein